jgi:photosynthetic reaction center H subunit
VLYAFWLFFAGVIYYLVRENRREGYPLETWRGPQARGLDPDARPEDLPAARRPHGDRAQRCRAAAQTSRASARRGPTARPSTPVGNPLLAGVGPGAWTERADHPDLDHHGQAEDPAAVHGAGVRRERP